MEVLCSIMIFALEALHGYFCLEAINDVLKPYHLITVLTIYIGYLLGAAKFAEILYDAVRVDERKVDAPFHT